MSCSRDLGMCVVPGCERFGIEKVAGYARFLLGFGLVLLVCLLSIATIRSVGEIPKSRANRTNASTDNTRHFDPCSWVCLRNGWFQLETPW